MPASPTRRVLPVLERHDLASAGLEGRLALARRILPEARMRHRYRDAIDLDRQLLAPRGGPATLHLFSVARTPLAWLVTHELAMARIGRDVPVLYVDLGMRPGAGLSVALARSLAAAALSFRLRRGGRSWLMLRPTWPTAFAWSRRLLPAATPTLDTRAPATAWHLRDTMVPALNLLSPLSGRSFACRSPRPAPRARWGEVDPDVSGAAIYTAATASAQSPTATDGATVLTLQRLHTAAVVALWWRARRAPGLDPTPALARSPNPAPTGEPDRPARRPLAHAQG